MYGGGFLFNTEIDIEANTISGYYVLISNNLLILYELDSVNLDSFRNTATLGRVEKTFTFNNVYDEHNIKIIADRNIYPYGTEKNLLLIIMPFQMFMAMVMDRLQAIKGKKFLNVLDNYNFESDNYRT